MADVFLSYAREDAARAEQIARALGAEGVQVFWDTEIPPGTTWADYIEQKLAQSKALIVLWSEHSTKSQWVREEARLGRDKGVLIPVQIDNTQPPFGFGELQAANLSGWNGASDDANWRRFVDAVRAAISAPPRAAPAPSRYQQAAAAQPAPQPAAAPAVKRGVPVWVWVAGAVVATVVVLGVIGMMMPSQPQQVAQTAPQPAMNQPAAPIGDRNPQQTNANQIQQITAAFAQQGYQMVGQPFTASMAQGQTANVPVEMHAGFDYRIVGVCDNDCANLDMVVFDGYGAAIGQDALPDSQPVVGILPTTSGMFTAQVQMISCTVAPCYYAVALYGRQAQ